MRFNRDLIQKVLSGEKTVTRRPLSVSKWCKVGQRTRVKDSEGKVWCWIKILDIKDETLGDIRNYDETEVRKEGFNSLDEFFNFWQALYKKIDLNLLVRRIEFKRVK